MKKLISVFFLAVSSLFLSFTEPISKARQLHLVAADSLLEYVGTYKMIDNAYFSTFKITLKEGALYGEADSNGANQLVKQDKTDTFKSTSQYGSIITFKRNTETKKVTGLSLNLQDTEMLGEKQ